MLLVMQKVIWLPTVVNYTGYWCTSSTDVKMPHDQVYEDRSLIQQSKSLLVLQEHLRQWEINLMATERELKRLHPEHTDSILRKYMLPDLPVIYIITPTYARPVQKAELTRLSHTFMLVKNIHWIVIEDAEKPSDLVRNFLKLSRLKYTHLSIATPTSYKMSSSDPSWRKPRGVLQRNEGITWLHKNLNQFRDSGVVYFADDDNTYDLQLFEEVSLCCCCCLEIVLSGNFVA